MFRKLLLKVALVAVVAAGVLSLTSDRASAGWHHWRSWGYSYYAPYASMYYPTVYHYSPAVYTPAYYYGSYSYPRYYGWGSYYRAGCCGWYGPRAISYYYRPARRTFCRPRCYTSCCTPVCSPCATTYYYDPGISCCGSTVVSKPAAAGVDTSPQPEPAPPEPAPPAPGPAPPEPGAAVPPAPAGGEPFVPAAPPTSTEPADTAPDFRSVLPPAPGEASDTSNNSAVLAVRVPEDAKVYINDRKTSTPGDFRQYVSNGLLSGYQYTYQVRADVVRNGLRVTKHQTVSLRAGDVRDVAFDFTQPVAVPVETTLTLQVPEDARVTLEGQEMSVPGAVRSFTTTQLSQGATWEDYDIVVSVERFGETLTRQESITLTGGQPTRLQIDFDAARVASR